MDAYRIKGPALVSFSGGRTSAFMLRKILDAHGGKLPRDYRVVFANTGREREETLDFVRDCGAAWGVRILWVEYRGRYKYRVVNHRSASRNGEPFEHLIHDKKFLPNPRMRFCTEELKVRAFRWAMHASEFDSWANVVGLRADEPHRVARALAQNDTDRNEWVTVAPLAQAGVAREDVMAFWGTSPFDLRIEPAWSNCDLCFLKGWAIRSQLAQERPNTTEWWERMESRIGASFRSDTPRYSELVKARSLPVVQGASEEALSCACTD